MTILEFLIGFSSPIIAAGIWFGVLKRILPSSLRGPLYQEGPGQFVFPVLLVVACLAVGAWFWESRRPLSLGLGVALGLALLVTVGFVLGGRRPGSQDRSGVGRGGR